MSDALVVRSTGTTHDSSAPVTAALTPRALGGGRKEALLEVDAAELSRMKAVVLRQQSVFFRLPLQAAFMLFLLGFCVFAIAFPSRHIGRLVDVAPTSNQVRPTLVSLFPSLPPSPPRPSLPGPGQAVGFGREAGV